MAGKPWKPDEFDRMRLEELWARTPQIDIGNSAMQIVGEEREQSIVNYAEKLMHWKIEGTVARIACARTGSKLYILKQPRSLFIGTRGDFLERYEDTDEVTRELDRLDAKCEKNGEAV